MRRAKIVCTLGPATADESQVLALVDAGMDVARLNLSHGTHAEHAQVLARIRAAAEERGRGVAVLADLQGPKIRLGRFAHGPVLLRPGDSFTITTDDCAGDESCVSTTYAGLPSDVSVGDRILVDDGRVSLEAVEVDETSVRTLVVEGGKVSDHKGINLPGVAVSVPALTEKDVEDLRWALNIGVDLIALSFVRTAADIEDVHRVMDEEGVRLPVLAKIEKPQAVEHLEAIVLAFDGIMVARGDLGVEMPLEQVPLVQKRAVTLARESAKPVIVATQMLESMISMSRPTRAEASDVANAVLDGADALMLSGETSVGAHPITAVATMARIIAAVEAQLLDELPELERLPRSKSGAIARAAVAVGYALDASALVAFTQTGTSARLLARYRSTVPILAFTPVPQVRRQLSLCWGVQTYLVPPVTHTDDMVKQVDAALLGLPDLEAGATTVIVAGSPPGIPGSTNAMRVHVMGDAVGEVAPAYRDAE
jgi:pyruvate kinase